MAFSLLGDLASARTEELVTERIVAMFTAIAAPTRSAYLQITESGPGRLVTVPLPASRSERGGDPGGEVDAARTAAIHRLAAYSGPWAPTHSGRGFALRIGDAEGTLGVLELEDVAIPASLEHYVNLGLGLVHVCGLAIRNARTYERLEGALADLRRAMAEVKTLRGILPICASCKRIRNDVGAWSQLEVYVSEHTDAQFTHGICPECVKKQFGYDVAEL